MASADYVADTSVFARLTKAAVAAQFAPLAATGKVAICSPVAFEIGFSARNHDDYQTVADRLTSFPFLAVTDADHCRALDAPAALAARAQHRALSLVDALVAAIAEARELTVLHYERDFELVAAILGQPTALIVPPGTAA